MIEPVVLPHKMRTARIIQHSHTKTKLYNSQLIQDTNTLYHSAASLITTTLNTLPAQKECSSMSTPHPAEGACGV